jgi:hypothetical protein
MTMLESTRTGGNDAQLGLGCSKSPDTYIYCLIRITPTNTNPRIVCLMIRGPDGSARSDFQASHPPVQYRTLTCAS